MYVMQSLPPKQQGLASGIMNTLVRLASTIAMGLATAVYSSVELSPQGQADQMLKFTRTFQVSVAMAGFSVLFVPFLRVGTQGHHEEDADDVAQPVGGAEGSEKAQAGLAGREKNEVNDVALRVTGED